MPCVRVLVGPRLHPAATAPAIQSRRHPRRKRTVNLGLNKGGPSCTSCSILRPLRQAPAPTRQHSSMPQHSSTPGPSPGATAQQHATIRITSEWGTHTNPHSPYYPWESTINPDPFTLHTLATGRPELTVLPAILDLADFTRSVTHTHACEPGLGPRPCPSPPPPPLPPRALRLGHTCLPLPPPTQAHPRRCTAPSALQSTNSSPPPSPPPPPTPPHLCCGCALAGVSSLY
jgi:hypothetical protein